MACGGSFRMSCGVPYGGVLLWREKGCEGGFLGLCGDVRGVGVLGREGLGVFVQGGCLCFGWFGCACAGLTPRPPPLLVGGGAPVGVWSVLRMLVCVWWRHGGCRPAPQL